MKNKFTLFFVLILLAVGVTLFQLKKTTKISSQSSSVKTHSGPEKVEKSDETPQLISQEKTELNLAVIEPLKLMNESEDDDFEESLKTSGIDFSDQEKLRQNRGLLIKSLNERFKMFYENDKKQIAKMKEESAENQRGVTKIDYFSKSEKEFLKNNKDLPVVEARKTPEEISKIKEAHIAKLKAEMDLMSKNDQ
jgi:hypothetical protein